MPFLRGSSSSSSSEFETAASSQDAQKIVNDADYAAKSFPGYAEKPLSEQLEPIAVIGMGCRLPGDIKGPDAFWKMMMNKESGQCPRVPASRFNIDAHFHNNNDRPGSFGVMGGYFLQETLQEFDPNFFGITPIEAMWMDPQQRKLLEVVYEAFESAGVTLNELAGSSTACFVASFTADFQQMAFKEPAFRHSLAATGVDPGIISNRISHVFNLRGPSIVVNTACSSSVYAIHNACNALRNEECAGAVVGGVNLVLTVDQHMNTAKLGVLSPTSTCHTFDASADGYGRAEGVGAVYLKRLSDAIRDGDPIRGLIRSSATNNNGKVPAVGITHPHLEGQEMVIKHAYARGGRLDPMLTGYFECHGTGTAVGDPLEVHAVANAMNEARNHDDGPLLVGAVKTNIGHSEAASGLSAVIKAILTVERSIIPPTRGVVNPSPAIDWKGWKVQVSHDPMSFPARLPVKRVSVNSFGYGGTNAHIIVESADSLLTQPQSYKYKAHKGSKSRMQRGTFNRNRPYLLLFSAHDRTTLKRNIEAHISIIGNYNLSDISYTLANKRTRFGSRGFAVANYANLGTSFSDGLREFVFGDKKKAPTIGFVFTGQGAQWARMGADLMTYYPSFLRSIRRMDMTLEDLEDSPDWTLEDALLADSMTSRVDEAEYSQPLCTAIQIALVQLLRLWGINPKVTVGHSSGEIAAAFAAGLLSASEAIVLAYYRGMVVRDIKTEGSMLAVGLSPEAIAPFFEKSNGQYSIACHNSPESLTLSGNADALKTLQSELAGKNIFARMLKTNGKAYHSSHMQPAAARYESLIYRAQASVGFDLPLETAAKMVSSVTNTILPENTILDAGYWSANLLSPVLFSQAVHTIATEPMFEDVDILIEIGPHSALAGPIRQIKSKFGFTKLHHLPTLLRGEDSAASLLKTAGELFLRDYPLAIERVTAIEEATTSGKITVMTGNLIVDLPTYQWDSNKKYWAEARASKEHRQPKFMRHDILGSMILGGSFSEPTWRNILRIRDLPWLNDHSLGGEAVFPAAAYFSMAIEAMTQLNETSAHPLDIQGYILRDISIKNALVTPDNDTGIEVIFNLRQSLHAEKDEKTPWWDFNVSSVSEEGYKNDHMAGSISINTESTRPAARKFPKFPQRASGKAWNQALRGVGFDYGPTFQDMQAISFDGKTYAAKSKTTIKQSVEVNESRHVLHPATVDSCLQLLIVAIYAGRTNAMKCGAVPIQVDQVSIWKPTDSQVAESTADAYSWIDQRGVRSFVGSNQLIAKDGQMVMEIIDMRCSLYEAAVPQRVEEPLRPQPFGEMVWKFDIDSLAGSEELDIASFVELADFKDPGLKVLDISSTYSQEILKRVPVLSIVVTVPLAELVEPCTATFKEYKNVQVKTLDMTVDLENQSFKTGSFDLIIVPAGSTAELDSWRKLLKVKGRIILESPNTTQIDSLTCSSFFKASVTCKDPSFVVATAIETVTNGVNQIQQKIQLIYRSKTSELFKKVKILLESRNYEIVISDIASIGEVLDTVIFLADFESPLLPTISEEEFISLQKITNGAVSILWATAGGLLTGKRPEFAMASGLMRSVTSEQISIDVITMDFDTDNTSTNEIASLILEKAEQQIAKAAHESEYCVSGGHIYISRLLPNDKLNEDYFYDEGDIKQLSYDPRQPIVGNIRGGRVVFEDDERKALDPGAVEVQVKVAGLNKEDTLIINGTDYPTSFSHEIAGTITRVGYNTKCFAVGDNVVGFSFDKFATFQHVPEHLLQRIEPNESIIEMASLPMAAGAALHGLKSLANLQQGETVLILQGSGLAGSAAIKITAAMGAKPYVAVKTQGEADAVLSLYDLEDNQVLLFSELSKLVNATGQYVVDVIFSSGWVDASVAREAWRNIAPFGRFVDCGRKNVLSRTILDTISVHRGASYLAFDMLDLHAWKPEVLSRLLALTISLYRQGAIAALQPLHVKNLAELNASVAAFSDNFHTGKTLLMYERSRFTLEMLPTRRTFTFKSDVTYLLVGCLGGLGRSLIFWMMRNGAKNFALLYRSGADSQQAASLIDSLEAAGANAEVLRGDVSVEADVKKVVENTPSSRPIRGVIQAAMVLKDGLFHNMPYKNWIASITPKVHGTMNLHRALEKVPLDFFVTTSSVSGTLGTPAQSNYAAANSFLDSLARHRHSKQQSAVSIILPMVLGVGVVAENFELEDALTRKGMYGIDEEHLMQAFEVSVLEQQNPRAASLDHLIVGLDAALLHKAVQDAGDDADNFWAADARFRPLIHAMSGSGSAAGGGTQSILSIITGDISSAEAMLAIRSHFIAKMARILMLDPENFEEEGRSIASYGIDSMIGAELRNWIFKELAFDIPFQQLLGPTLTINKFSGLVCSKLGYVIE